MASANEQLLAAAEAGDLDAVKRALSEGANIETVDDWYESTALIIAATNNRGNVVRYLISRGANIDSWDRNGWTALVYAANNGLDQIVNILLGDGANVNTQANNGQTALMWAAMWGNYEIVNILQSKRANVNTQDNNGQTAIMIAAEMGRKEAVKVLITHSADVSVKDDHGLTALDLAIKPKFAALDGDYPAVINILSTPPAATPDLAGIPSGDMNPSLSAVIKEPVPVAIKEPVPAAIKEPVPVAIKESVPAAIKEPIPAAIKELVPENPQPVLSPNISFQPASVLEVEEGKDISLTVIAEGSIPLTYQWNRDGEQLQDGIQCDGSSTNCLLVKQANIGIKGQYCCTVSNIKGVVTSSPTSLTIVYAEDQFEKLSQDQIMELVDNKTVLGICSLCDVINHLGDESANWQQISTRLHIASNTIQGLATSNKTNDVRLMEALTEWLKLNYNFQKHGKPTWRMVAESVANINNSLFLKIAKKHLMKVPANIRHQPTSRSDITTEALENRFKLTDELIDHPIEGRHSFYVSDQFGTSNKHAGNPSHELNEGEQHTISANPNLINSEMKMKDKDVSPPSSKRMKMSPGSVACKAPANIRHQPTCQSDTTTEALEDGKPLLN